MSVCVRVCGGSVCLEEGVGVAARGPGSTA